MKVLINIMFVLLVEFVYSQNIKTEYRFYFSTNDENYKSELSVVDTISRYEIFETAEDKGMKRIENEYGTKLVYKPRVYLNRIIIKNFSTNSLNYFRPDFINNNEYIKIKEKLNPDIWTLMDGEKIILGYTCHKAYCKFKEKYYTAWYTNDIPISDGPWKFNGLPGLILQIESKDGTFVMTAEKITINIKNSGIKEKIQFKKEYTWEEYVERMKKLLRKMEKFTISSNEYLIEADIKFDEPDCTIRYNNENK